MHGRRIGLDLAHYVDRLRYGLGPVFGMQREGASGLGLSYQHAVQSNVHYTNAGRKILNRTRHAALESVLALNVKGDGRGLTRLDSKLSRFRSNRDIRGRN